MEKALQVYFKTSLNTLLGVLAGTLFLNHAQAMRITPELLLSRTLKSSLRVKSIRELEKSAELETLQSRALLDSTLKAKTLWIQDRREASSPFALSDSKTFLTEIEAAKYFSTGTLLGAKVSHTDFKASVPSGPTSSQINSNEPYVEVSLAQNILKDAFGSDTRKELRAGELLSRARAIESEVLLEQWALEIVGTFLEARSLQQSLLILDETVSARERLLRVSTLRGRRGTLEEKDLKKIEASLSDVKLQRSLTENSLRNTLYLLIVVADFPRDLVKMDLRKIDLGAGTLQGDQCAVLDVNSTVKSKEQQKAEFESQAYKLRAESLEGSLLPELQVFGALGANAVDKEFNESWKDVSTDPNPVWRVGLQAQWTFGNSAAKSRYMQGRLLSLDRDAVARDKADAYEVQTDDLCRNIQFYKVELEQREAAGKILRRAYTLQEKDFGIGRSTVFEVVQSTEEWLNSRRALSMAEKNYWLSKWELLRVENRLTAYLQQLEGAAL